MRARLDAVVRSVQGRFGRALGVLLVALLLVAAGIRLGDLDWTAIGTLALAVVTVVVIGIDARERRTKRVEARRRLYRAALVEQVENCRRWLRWDPGRGLEQARRLVHDRPPFTAVERLIGDESLGGDVLAVLIWLVGDTRYRVERFGRCVGETVGDAAGACRNDWWAVVDDLQALALLLLDQARADPDLVAITGPFRVVPWLVPLPGTPDERFHTHAERVATQHAPLWPTDPVYARSSPSGRDKRAAQAQAAREASLPVSPIGRR